MSGIPAPLIRGGAAVLFAMSSAMQAQSLPDRIAAADSGAVSFHFTARPGVCGDGEHFIRTGRHSYHGSFARGWDREPCVAGPVQVRVSLQDGAVERIQYWVGPVRPRVARDLGAVSAPEAARWLMAVAARGNAPASAKAIFPAVLADSAEVWPQLLAIARDSDTRSRSTRQDALFWLSRYAGAAVMGRRNDPFDFDSDSREKPEDEDLKAHALFVLSQLPRGEGVPELLQVARTNKDPRVRSQAFFWLGQSGDPRAIALFESVLRS